MYRLVCAILWFVAGVCFLATGVINPDMTSKIYKVIAGGLDMLLSGYYLAWWYNTKDR